MQETGVKVPNEFVLHTRHRLKKQKQKNINGSIALQMTGMLLKPTAHRHEPKTDGKRGKKTEKEDKRKWQYQGHPQKKGGLFTFCSLKLTGLWPYSLKHPILLSPILLLRGLSGQTTRGDAPNKKNIQQNLIISCVKQTHWGSTGCFFVL